MINNQTVNQSRRVKPIKAGRVIQRVLIYAALIAAALVMIVPFYMIIITALKRTNALATAQPFIWFPSFKDLSFQSFANLFSYYTVNSTGNSMIMTGIKNTLIITIPVVIVGMFASSISAYAFAKINFRLKNVMFSLLLFSMMLPGIVLMVPSFILYDTLYLTDTFFPLMAPPMFGSAACVFFLRQFFRGIPDELIDAGKIDGMSYVHIYFTLILPLSVPALLAQGILGFIGGYNDYLGPLIYLRTEEMYTLQVALGVFAGGVSTDLPTVMAAAIFAMIPSVIIYFLTQKYFITGIAMSGLKA